MEYGRRWMQNHRKEWDQRLIKELCIPGSHDAGAYNIQWSTWGGTKGNVVTQTKTIYEQLELGVRKFDIRPKLVPNANKPWSCGHGTDSGLGALGWQGAIGASIQDVVADINRFTKDKEELIFLDVNEINVINYGVTSPGTLWDNHGYLKNYPDGTQWFALLDLLSDIKSLYRKEHAAYTDKPFEDYQLGDFIGKGQSAVVVVIDYGDTKPLYERGLWPNSCLHLEGLTQLKLPNDEPPPRHLQTLCRMMVVGEAIWSTVTAGNAVNLEGLAREHHNYMFPLLLHRIFWEKKQIQTLEMDFIENLDLLTFCLAVTQRRHNHLQGKEKMVVYYCAKPVTHSFVLSKMREAIDAGKPYRVSDIETSDGNPWPEGQKCCTVLYPHNEIIKGRYGRQDGWLHFEHDIIRILKGPMHEVRNQIAYYNLWNNVGEHGWLHCSNDDLGLLSSEDYGHMNTVEFRREGGTKVEKVSGKGNLPFPKSSWEMWADVPSIHEIQ